MVNENNLIFDFSALKLKPLVKDLKPLQAEVEIMKKAITKEYDSEYASLALPSDFNQLAAIEQVFAKVKDAQILVVIGIGGSNLGTLAVYQAMKGLYANELNEKKVYFADTCDSLALVDIIEKLKEHVLNKQKIVVNIISKSGGTTETIANFNVIMHTLRRIQKEWREYVVVTTEKDSKLYAYAKNQGFETLLIPNTVGGRYSVLSTVGLFPLKFLGVDIRKLVHGAFFMRKTCLEKEFKNNPAMQSAFAIFSHAKTQSVVNSFFFASQLEGIGRWYRQLFAESLGKEKDRQGKIVHTGLTPTTAIGSTDLHSMAQLYLGGPNVTFHVFVNIASVTEKVLDIDPELEQIVSHIGGKSTHVLMDAILNGTRTAFIQKNRPLYSITLPQLSEETIGALLQMKMMEVMLLAKLFNVNPFDQPNVEEYKIVTKKLLAALK